MIPPPKMTHCTHEASEIGPLKKCIEATLAYDATQGKKWDRETYDICSHTGLIQPLMARLAPMLGGP